MSEIEAAQHRWSAMSPGDRASVGPATMSTCATALHLLRDRLVSEQYPVEAMLTPCPDLADTIARFEAEGVIVPPPLRLLWEQVGLVTLVDTESYRHTQFWVDQGIRFMDVASRFEPVPQFCDGVCVEAPCSPGWLEYQLDEFELQRSDGEPLAFVMAPDGYHKDNISGGDPYEVVPSPHDPWMPMLRGFDWAGPHRPSSAPTGPVDLVSYLRTAVLECGGFPGLFGSADFEPLRQRLTADLPRF